jgi:DNA helicase II / ATP-dependent DNA helicase PcrA
MEISLDTLNPNQREAVTTDFQHVRIIAGAGSGKTRVLTLRIAYLMETLSIQPEMILAITFTNKVAKEMLERAEKIVPQAKGRLKIMTYHSFAARFLRREIGVLKYPQSFTIIDEDDQEKLVKTIGLEMDVRKGDPLNKKALSYIRAMKTKGVYPDDITIVHEQFPQEKLCLEYYTKYEEKLKRNANLDFDDLLMKTLYILKNFPMVREKWQARFHHILIDEFQDTNNVQYDLVRLLLKPSSCLYVVGDPDQTIYTWRGANQDIILSLDKTFAIETIILNQNYRSTKTILDVANKLIDCNKYRVKKDLFSTLGQGEPIRIKKLLSQDEEALDVIQHMLGRHHQGVAYKDMAILYRANYLTLPFEKMLNRFSIPYRIFGGMRFYQRQEIKDVLAYFRLLVNPLDDVALERIINIPRRGIGDKAWETIKAFASQKEMAILPSLIDFSHTLSLKGKVLEDVKHLVAMIQKTQALLQEKLEIYSEILRQYLDDVGYMGYLKDLDEDDRFDNVQTLFQDLDYYLQENPEADFNSYIENVALTSAQDEIVDDDYVSLMTVHTAKGLEFNHVYVIGLNEGVFPSIRSMDDEAFMGVEEERRLCYVAMTRARQTLSLSCSGDYSFQMDARLIPSRFFKEAGLEFPRTSPLLETSSRLGPKSSSPTYQPLPSPSQVVWAVGDKIRHEVFGFGEVRKVIDAMIIEVYFETMGIKKLMGNHPKLAKVDA